MPDSSSELSVRHDMRVESLRTTAKWLVTIAAGVGAILAAGLQLSGLGRLPLTSWRLYAAVAAALIALAAVGYMVKVSSAVLTQEWLTLSDFTNEAVGLTQDGAVFKPSRHVEMIERELTNYRDELYGHAAPSLAMLLRRLREANAQLANASGDAAVPAAARSAELRQVARDVTQAANYCLALYLFGRMRVRLAWASVAVVASIIVFAYAANPPPKPPAPIDVRIISSLHPASLPPAATVSP